MRLPAALACLAAVAGCSEPNTFAFSGSGISVAPPPPAPESGLVRIGGDTSLPPPPPDFASLGIPRAPAPDGQSGFRTSSMRDAALSWGARAGQARRSWEIAVSYSTRTAELDAAWDFSRVAVPAPLSSGWLLPPVVQRGGAVWTGGGRSAEAATEYYSILRPGRISGRLPNWRDYLPLPSESPDPPVGHLLPLDGEERQWREWAAEGWLAGFKLAEAELDESLARMERDFTGMLEFRRLLAMGIISDLVVEAENWPASVTGDGGELRVGGRRVRIVSDAGFVSDTGRWRPQVVPVRPAPGWSSFPPILGTD